MRYITSAPEAYDYWYVTTVATVPDRYGKEARIVESTDAYRFEHYQKPRYHSGLHYCWPLDSEDGRRTLPEGYVLPDFGVVEEPDGTLTEADTGALIP